ncbi:MAG: flavin reductase [Acidobacteriota bacterium]
MDTRDLVTLDPEGSPWEQVFTVAPLVLVGSLEPTGALDLAPKHLAMPLGWGRHFGFVCREEHSTYRNIRERREFSVTYPLADEVLLASLAASPREPDDTKPALRALPTLAPTVIETPLFAGGYLFLECRLDRFVDGFGPHSLITGEIVAARAARQARRLHELDEAAVIERTKLLAFLSPSRFAAIDESWSFPFPAGFHR